MKIEIDINEILGLFALARPTAESEPMQPMATGGVASLESQLARCQEQLTLACKRADEAGIDREMMNKTAALISEDRDELRHQLANSVPMAEWCEMNKTMQETKNELARQRDNVKHLEAAGIALERELGMAKKDLAQAQDIAINLRVELHQERYGTAIAVNSDGTPFTGQES